MRLLLSILLCFILVPAQALEKVSLQLNWKHQFQFAGYYAAIEQGYFREAGFDVSLRELSDGHDPITAVLNGEADYGVAASELARASRSWRWPLSFSIRPWSSLPIDARCRVSRHWPISASC